MGILQHKQDTEQEPSWIRYARNRIKKRKNFLCLMFGATGSGKSWSCLSVALMLDKTFNIARCVFGLKGLMELINSGENFPAGTCFVWDEFQIEGGSRNWQSLTNKLLNSLLSTFRHKNFIVLINAPYGDFIDSQTRKLLHAEMELIGIDYNLEMTVLKPMIIQYNSKTRKFYYKYLRIKTARGIAPITKWKIPKPPKWIIEEYERKKTEFTEALNRDIEEQLNKQRSVKLGKKKPLTAKQDKILNLMSEYQDVSKVAKKLKTSERTIYFHIAQARKKGYNYEMQAENTL
jgi:DNA-binding CsgD family transcriptional regulator